MKKIFCFLVLINFTLNFQAQSSFEEENIKYRKGLNKSFKSKKKSPLPKKDIRKFKKLDFFSINKKYRVKAKFIKSDSLITFQMKTSTSRLPNYDKYGKVEFEIDGVLYSLNVYQSHNSRSIEKYKDHLFLPFNDLTNGIETYGGGRYIDLKIPNKETIVIDFNKAYNPYCAYSYRYSCPIPPEENNLDIRIEAGVKSYKKH